MHQSIDLRPPSTTPSHASDTHTYIALNDIYNCNCVIDILSFGLYVKDDIVNTYLSMRKTSHLAFYRFFFLYI